MKKSLRYSMCALPIACAIALTGTAGAELLGESDYLSEQARMLNVFAVLDGEDAECFDLNGDDPLPMPGGVHNEHTDTHYKGTTWHWKETTQHKPDTVTHFTTSELHNKETKFHHHGTGWIDLDPPKPIK